jgi:hypothetical protein
MWATTRTTGPLSMPLFPQLPSPVAATAGSVVPAKEKRGVPHARPRPPWVNTAGKRRLALHTHHSYPLDPTPPPYTHRHRHTHAHAHAHAHARTQTPPPTPPLAPQHTPPRHYLEGRGEAGLGVERGELGAEVRVGAAAGGVQPLGERLGENRDGGVGGLHAHKHREVNVDTCSWGQGGNAPPLMNKARGQPVHRRAGSRCTGTRAARHAGAWAARHTGAWAARPHNAHRTGRCGPRWWRRRCQPRST